MNFFLLLIVDGWKNLKQIRRRLEQDFRPKRRVVNIFVDEFVNSANDSIIRRRYSFPSEEESAVQINIKRERRGAWN